ncbi:MAG: hypothetical protein ABUT20_39975 [Bacteroidota bacterium]
MVTRRITKSKYIYEEINPFYYGNSPVIYSPYRNAITLGTSFVTMPRGTYNNMMNARNRTQQLLYIQARVDGFQLNVYEDYLLVTDGPLAQWICDNRDRYYTGGGNIQVRLSPFARLKIYSEMYTGTSYVDKQDYPDVAFPDSRPAHILRKSKADALNRKYAYQDPGQMSFNRARNFICLDYAIGAKMYELNKAGRVFWCKNFYNHQVQFILGRQNGEKNMLQQNFIHNLNKVDRDSKEKTNTRSFSSLHHFDFSDNFLPKTIWGIGTTSSY